MIFDPAANSVENGQLVVCWLVLNTRLRDDPFHRVCRSIQTRVSLGAPFVGKASGMSFRNWR